MSRYLGGVYKKNPASLHEVTQKEYEDKEGIGENFPAYSLNGETNPAKWDGILSETVEGATKYCGPTKRNAD